MSKSVALSHPFFAAVTEGLFRKSEAGDPVFCLKLGDVAAALPISSICREFEIDAESEDGVMLDRIVRALDFVNGLRLGDPLPSEVLTGAPSWEVNEAHRLRAYQRLTLQFTTWLTGEERVFTSADELNQIAEDPVTKRKVNEALDEAARRLGLTENGRNEVMKIVVALAEELAFIEALRDRFDAAAAMKGRIQQLARSYGRDNYGREISASVLRLMTIALRTFEATFQEIDAQTGEILSVLRHPVQQTRYICKTRDDLYCRFFAWRDVLGRWEGMTLASEGNIVLLRDTYRFLALRHMPAADWQLMSKLTPGGEPGKRKTSVVW